MPTVGGKLVRMFLQLHVAILLGMNSNSRRKGGECLINQLGVEQWFNAPRNWMKENKRSPGLHELIQSLRACGRKMVCSWWNWAYSWLHSYVGSSTWMYCYCNEVSRCRRRIRRVCHLQTGGNSAVILASRTLTSFPAARNVLASLFHSRNLLPSSVNASKMRGWRCDSLDLVSVDIMTGLYFVWEDAMP